MSLEVRLQTASSEYQKLESDLSNVVEARQKLDAQLSETEQVKKEFGQLQPSNTVYKLIGPVLVKQDQNEAKATVETRLEYIRAETKRVEAQLQDLSSRVDKKKAEIVELQSSYQEHQKQTASPPSAVKA